MNGTVRLLILIACILFVPLFSGATITRLMKRQENKNLLVCYLVGVMLSWTVFQFMVLPMIFMGIKFHVLFRTYSITMLVLCVAGIIIGFKEWGLMVKNTARVIKSLPVFFIIVLLAIGLQAAASVYFEHIDEDDAFYVATAVVTDDTDTMFKYNPYTGDEYDKLPSRYVLSPWPVFISVVSETANVHPTVMAHTLLPAALIPLVYACLMVLGNRLLRGNKRTLAVFMLLLTVLNMYGFSSIYTTETFMLYRVWQGKAILAAILLPLLLYACMNAMAKESGFGDWVLLFLISTAATMVSSMGIFLAPLTFGLMTLIYAIKRKKISILFKAALCVLPCFVFGMMYVFIR